jgi:hypothetical protein
MESEKASTPPILQDQREGIPLFVDRNMKAGRLLVKSMEEVVAGSIGRITGAGETRPSEGPLGYFPILVS